MKPTYAHLFDIYNDIVMFFSFLKTNSNKIGPFLMNVPSERHRLNCDCNLVQIAISLMARHFREMDDFVFVLVL